MNEIKVIDIDPETGLPRLPEGHFYRVHARSVSIMKNLGAGKWRPGHPGSDFVPGPEYETRTVIRSIPTVYRPWFYFGFRRHGTEVRNFAEYRRKNISEHIFSYREDAETGEMSSELNDNQVRINQENLLSMAESCRLAWVAEQRASRILGDYPPNRFER